MEVINNNGQITINATDLSPDEIKQLQNMGFDVAEQGSERWHQDRLGDATASRAIDIVKRVYKTKDNPDGRPSDTYYTYANELVAERITGKDKRFSTNHTRWGNEKEAEAAEAYEERTGNEVRESEYVKHRTLRAGASPDRLVNDEGLMEIKCPNTDTFVSFVLFLKGVDDKEPRDWQKYYHQMQYQMWVTNRKWCDFVLYDPEITETNPLYIHHVERDPSVMNQFERLVPKFLQSVDRKERIIKEL